MAGASPRVPLLIATEDDDVDGASILTWLRQGATGILSLQHELPRLPQAVCDVASGQPYLSPSLVKMLVGHIAGNGRRPAGLGHGLTGRETQVLLQLTAGRSHAEIADALEIDERTVRHHLEQVYRKLGVRNRLEAVVLAYRQGLAA